MPGVFDFARPVFPFEVGPDIFFRDPAGAQAFFGEEGRLIRIMRGIGVQGGRAVLVDRFSEDLTLRIPFDKLEIAIAVDGGIGPIFLGNRVNGPKTIRSAAKAPIPCPPGAGASRSPKADRGGRVF